jgi:hypothetical protein
MISAWPVCSVFENDHLNAADEWHAVRSVQLDDLVRELVCRHHVRRSSGTLGVLQADVDQGQQNGVL